MLTFFIILILLFISGFFSGSETGLTSASLSKLHRLKMEGNKRAATALDLLKLKDKLISTILLGNNAINTTIATLATILGIKLLGEKDGPVYATVRVTLLLLVFAEILPKTFAINNQERVAIFVAPIFAFLVKMFTPIICVVNFIINIFLKLFFKEVQPLKNVEGTEALKGAIALQHSEGYVVKDDKDMLGGILALADICVGDIMIHRKEIESININHPLQEIFAEISESMHSRIPFYDDKQEEIIGILHTKDLLNKKLDGEEITKSSVRGLLKQPWYIPENTSVKEQLEAFRKKQSHFAFVVDEYGTLLGVITLEDILEEIVGQIEDEHDVTIKEYKKLQENTYLIKGTANIRDINRALEWNLPDKDAKTISGILINACGIIPEVNQIFQFFGYQFEVVKKQKNLVSLLKLEKLSEEETPN